MERALIVDPDRESVRRLSEHLTDLGIATTVAGTMAGALALAGPPPTVLVCELSLPDGKGLELAELIAGRGPAPRTVLFTETPTYDACRAAWKAGYIDLLAKPIDLDALDRALDSGSEAGLDPIPAVVLRGPTSGKNALRAIRVVLAFALQHGVPPAARARLGSAVHEVIENTPGEFHLSARREDGEIVVRVCDRSSGLEEPPAALPFATAAPGGLARAQALVEKMDVESSPVGTRVTLRISALPAVFEGEALTDLSDLDHLDPNTARRILSAIERRRSSDLFNIPPSIAVCVGRLLAGPDRLPRPQTTSRS